MNILVTGGAGYIGSVVVAELLRDGHEVTVYDNLSKGHREAITPGAELIKADLRDQEHLKSAIRQRSVEGVIHMAADSLVGESVAHPSKYYQNNLFAGLTLLDAMRDEGVTRIVFSSTAAVYGEPAKQPIEESDLTHPTNPYGESKLGQ
jgi:UDP-glucose 4-epimerase